MSTETEVRIVHPQIEADLRRLNKPKRKYTRKAAAKTAPPKVSAEFAGMTATECCAECNSKRCVITGIGICGHPMKGGLQAPMMVKADVVDRYNRARKVLAHVRLDKLP